MFDKSPCVLTDTEQNVREEKEAKTKSKEIETVSPGLILLLFVFVLDPSALVLFCFGEPSFCSFQANCKLIFGSMSW